MPELTKKGKARFLYTRSHLLHVFDVWENGMLADWFGECAGKPDCDAVDRILTTLSNGTRHLGMMIQLTPKYKEKLETQHKLAETKLIMELSQILHRWRFFDNVEGC